MISEPADKITDEILGSKKYSGIDRDLVFRTCEKIIPRYNKKKETIKAIKNELHIIHESFIKEDSHIKAEALLDKYTGTGIVTDRELAAKLMSLHSSTKERLAQAAEIYEYLCKYINENDIIHDIGCGFNPFALPFFTVKPKHYTASDISNSTVNLIQKYFRMANLSYHATVMDAATQLTETETDILLMLKLSPLLERQKKGRTAEILESIKSKTIIVSFPTKSASGKEKGMETFYSTQFESTLPACVNIIDKTVFRNEMFYILRK